MDNDGGIGKNNKIPWHIKKDLVRLRDLTKDKVAILGRTSYESMAGYYDKSGRDMPARQYIVVTRNADFKSKRGNTFTATSIQKAIKRVQELGDTEVFVIGGAKIFAQFIGFADRIYATIVDGNFNCDTFFPEYENFNKLVSDKRDSENGIEFHFKILEK